jgi:hypothetical protein
VLDAGVLDLDGRADQAREFRVLKLEQFLYLDTWRGTRTDAVRAAVPSTRFA